MYNIFVERVLQLFSLAKCLQPYIYLISCELHVLIHLDENTISLLFLETSKHAIYCLILVNAMTFVPTANSPIIKKLFSNELFICSLISN